jgi:Leucine-rich repeat (LRR) protein
VHHRWNITERKREKTDASKKKKSMNQSTVAYKGKAFARNHKHDTPAKKRPRIEAAQGCRLGTMHTLMLPHCLIRSSLRRLSVFPCLRDVSIIAQPMGTKTWWIADLTTIPLLETFSTLRLGNIVVDKDLDCLAAMKHLKELQLTFTSATGACFAFLPESLECLHADGNHIVTGLPHLFHLPNLRSLTLSHIHQDDLHHLGALGGRLEYLSVAYRICELTDANLGFLLDMSRLKELNISGSRVTDAGLADVVVRVRSLQALRLSACMGISDAGLSALQQLPTLTSLSLNSTSITAAGLVALVSCNALAFLSLQHCRNLGEVFLPSLAPMRSLRHLDVSYTAAGDDDLVHVGLLSSLESLRLFHCYHFSDDGIRLLQLPPTLTSLDLQDTNIADGGLAHVVSVGKALKNLNLWQCDRITGAGWQLLKKLPLLHSLDVRDTCMSDSALDAIIRDIPSLAVLRSSRT